MNTLPVPTESDATKRSVAQRWFNVVRLSEQQRLKDEGRPLIRLMDDESTLKP